MGVRKRLPERQFIPAQMAFFLISYGTLPRLEPSEHAEVESPDLPSVKVSQCDYKNPRFPVYAAICETKKQPTLPTLPTLAVSVGSVGSVG